MTVECLTAVSSSGRTLLRSGGDPEVSISLPVGVFEINVVISDSLKAGADFIIPKVEVSLTIALLRPQKWRDSC